MNGVCFTQSIINGYPIDYDEYPLAKNVPFEEYILEEQDYLYIPDKWFHWVFTEPYTLSFSYVINKSKSVIVKDDISSFVLENIPFKGKGSGPLFDLEQFINDNNKLQVMCLSSITNDVSSVLKNGYDDTSKYTEQGKLESFLKRSNKGDPGHRYILHDNLKMLKIGAYQDIHNVIPTKSTFSFINTLWFNLDKEIDSGLHYDENDERFLYVAKGKKRVLLAPPKYIDDLYVLTMPRPIHKHNFFSI